MVEKFNYPKEQPSRDIKRNLHGIKKTAKWQENIYKEFEKVKDEDGGDMREYSAEAVEIFNESLRFVFEFLKKQGININDLKINKFDVYVTKKDDIGGQYNTVYDKIYISEASLSDKERAKEIFIHEIFHKLSASALYMTQYKQENKEFIGSIKSGYSSSYFLIEKKLNFARTKEKNLFEAFNEGVTDLLTFLALSDKGRDYANNKSRYKTETAMAAAIMSNVYGQKNYREFIMNYFSGRMMHLRKIEKYYGKGSLGLLAGMGTKDNYKHRYGNDKQLLEKIYEERDFALEFFTTRDKSKREELRKKLTLEGNA
ncbi:MAG: hypothetical protein ACD_37C00584G0001 [uncultured bacterium]|nr:MAG: hypothetical protein ACD_37C00584G0001 [uncultured bacterium]